jgi:hypothetical protein
MPQDVAAASGYEQLRPAWAFTATVNPANHTAVASVNTDVTVPAGSELLSTDRIVAIPPATLEAGICVQGCVYKDASTLTLRTTNPSAGAIDPASATWTFMVFRA